MPEKVLFIGHSLVGYIMPEMLNAFSQTLDLGFGVDAQVINGAPLRYNWEHGDLAQGVDARTVLPSGEYDAVVVTEALPLDDHLLWNDTHGYAGRYFDLAYQSNPDVQFYVYETWHNIGANPAQWRAQLDQDLHKWEGIAEAINDSLPLDAKPALVVPAGQAMARLYDAIEAQEVPSLTAIHDVFDDDIHLNDIGNWFLSVLQAATVIGVDPASLPAETIGRYGVPYDAPDAALADALVDIVRETLEAYAHDGRGDLPVDDEEQDTDDDGADDPNGDPVSPDDPSDPDPTDPDTSDPDSTNDDTDPPGGDDPADTPPAPTDPGTSQPPASDPIVGLGFGLSSVADYVTNMPFLDIFKTARDWFGHEEGQWGGITSDDLIAAGVFDADGWPTEIPTGVDAINTLILTDFPAEMTQAAGRYRVTWEGEGTLQIGLGAVDVSMAENEAWFSYTPTDTNLVSIEIHSTDPSETGDYIRNISVVKQEHIPAFESGEMFNPEWISVIEDAHAFRFMDWMETNNSEIAIVSDAPQVTDASWTVKGVPLDVMVRLANETGVDPWFNIPHLADEAYIRAFVTQVHDTLDPALKAYFEFSNEVWNFQFEQAVHSHVEGQERFDGAATAWVQNYAADAVAMAQIVDDVFGANSPQVVKVIATQTGWIGLEEAILDAPNWVAEDAENNAAPSTYFDSYAVTGYFDGGLGRDAKPLTVKEWLADSLGMAEQGADQQGLTGAERSAYVAAHQYDHATTLAVQELRDGSVTGQTDGSLAHLRDQFTYHKAVADARGLDMIMYEGGTHVVGVGGWREDTELTEFFIHLNYTPQMGDLYRELLEIWVEEGGSLFNAFTAVGSPSKYGSWGHLRFAEDETARYDAIAEFLTQYPKSNAPLPDDTPPIDDPIPDDDASDGDGPNDDGDQPADESPAVHSLMIDGGNTQGDVLSVTWEMITGAGGVDPARLSLQWLRDGLAISGETAISYTLTQVDVDAQISVALTYAIYGGAAETLYASAVGPVEDVNDMPTGNLLISDGYDAGHALHVDTANIYDADGIVAQTMALQWLRNGSAIEGANASVYAVTAADAGQSLSVVFSYTDSNGNNHNVSGRSVDIKPLAIAEAVVPPADQLTGDIDDNALPLDQGDDGLTGDALIEVIKGSAGFDTVTFEGSKSGYTLRLSPDGAMLIHRSAQAEGQSSTTFLNSIEMLDFGAGSSQVEDDTLALQGFGAAGAVAQDDLAEIAELYVAYFNRAPDAMGLAYWAGRFADGFSLKKIAASFFDQAETRATYADDLAEDGVTLVDTVGFVTTVYANVLGRAPDAEGLAYWIRELNENDHISPPTFILSLILGAKYPGAPNAQMIVDQQHIQTKTDIGLYFGAIKGMSDVSNAETAMGLFDGTDQSARAAIDHIDAAYTAVTNGTTDEFLVQLIGSGDQVFSDFF